MMVSDVPSLLTSTAPTGSTYAAPPPPQAHERTEIVPSSAQTGQHNSRVTVHADQPHQGHEASATSSTAQQQQTGFGASLPSLPSLQPPSYAAPPPPNFATHPSAPPPHTYSDDIGLHSSSYTSSPYESVPSYSPWPAHSSLPSHSELHSRFPPGYPYPPPTHYWSQAPTKMDEPLLAPGELPAPRPPMSYAALIGEALLLAAPPHQLYVSEISDSIKRRYSCECPFRLSHEPSAIHNHLHIASATPLTFC